MLKQHLVPILAILLFVSILANVMQYTCGLGGIEYHVPKELVGSWRSVSPAGLQLILTHNGEFLLTNYGTPYGPCGRWSVSSGEMNIKWSFDEEPAAHSLRSTRIDISGDKQEFRLTKDIFYPHATVFRRTNGTP